MAVKDSENRWMDPKGNAIPMKYVDIIDKMTDRMVMKVFKQALKASEELKKLHSMALAGSEELMNATSKKYNVTIRTAKGNKRFTDFSNTIRLDITIGDFIDFDERLNTAKALIDKCIEKWSEDADDKIKLLINNAFKVDKKGNLDKHAIMGLRNLAIKDTEWKKAMELITDSIRVIDRKAYLKFSSKDDNGNWHGIPLDISRV